MAISEKRIGEMSKDELLEFARNRIFFLGLRDLAAALSYENMQYGLGKMIYALDSGDVYSVFGPDATITRNVGRWMSGFGYGVVIRWPDNGVFFPEIRPNGCGMILVRLDEMPRKDDIIERISELEKSDIYLDGTKLKPDFGKGNHFFEFYKVINTSPEIEHEIPEDANYAIIHGSSPEKKSEIYSMIDTGNWVKTPLGKISVLDGEDAKQYYRKWLKFEKFAKKRREFLAREILGDCKILSNLTHQGIFKKNEIRLGCHDTMDESYPPGEALFPVALRWDHPVYIFKGFKNLSDEVIGRLDFDSRVDELGIRDELKNINILPHGGGYSIKLEYSNIEIINTEIGNCFILSGARPVSRVDEIDDISGISRFGRMIVTNPHELPYDYRVTGIIEKVMEYKLAKPVAKLQPLMTIKI
ncbi:MAG: hypothetical protein DRO94_04890 [Candidatus Altiarchaeales archaeon]|nr:MAG: hypothetical protein DRO95_04045 [Candidatus Altiarchaeales archaeon]RLI93579.1 MAG: hypothetical protein DRO94_04890 [Candidatus Altiarchaeales archaeon]HDO82445.1 hypothetical protein [Candidatus Altiarchaeales archaeon]HEX55094.1 hypothetical protein [Candidatus Altiarchaeales archaeon]